jgi:hypothetical protein
MNGTNSVLLVNGSGLKLYREYLVRSAAARARSAGLDLVRRGGGGNFGVNTSFTFRAWPVRDSSTCLLLRHWAHAPEVLVRMQEVMAHAPDEFAARIGASRAAGEEGMVSVIGQHLGPAEELQALLAPALALAEPYRVDIADRTHWEAKDFLHHTTFGDPFAVRTRCAPKPLSEVGVATMLAAIDKWPGSSNPDGAGVALFTWGGAINRVPVADSAFPHRGRVVPGLDGHVVEHARLPRRGQGQPGVADRSPQRHGRVRHRRGLRQLHRSGSPRLAIGLPRPEPRSADRGETPLRPDRVFRISQAI